MRKVYKGVLKNWINCVHRFARSLFCHLQKPENGRACQSVEHLPRTRLRTDGLAVREEERNFPHRELLFNSWQGQ